MFAGPNLGGRWRVPFEINSAVPLLADVVAARTSGGPGRAG